MYPPINMERDVVRKVLHVAFTLVLLIVPLITKPVDNFDPVLEAYAMLVAGATFLNSIQVRRGSHFVRSLDRLVDMLRKSLIHRLIEPFEKLAASVEREYEKAFGYVAITFGSASVLVSYIFFGSYVVYGILALMIIDGLNTLLAPFIGRTRLPYGKGFVEVAIVTALIYAAAVYVVSRNITLALALAAVAVIVEAYSIEDNVTVPLLTSFTAAAVTQALPIQLPHW